jgi:large subunit ribosomal protein L6
MSMTDPISDLLTRIRNAHLAKHDRLDVPVSRLKLEVCRILKEEGFIRNYREVETTGPSGSVRIFLRYSPQGEPAINHVARISKPGRRIYRRAGEIQPVRNGLGVGIVSTSQGLLTDTQARERKKMSRIGKMPIPVPSGTRIEIQDGQFVAEGPKGKVAQPLFDNFPVKVDGNVITIERPGDTGPERAKHGLLRALLNNAVQGVSSGFTKQLDIVGVGYRAEVKGPQVQFALGYSHPVMFDIPEGITIAIDAKANRVTVSGADRQKVGQVAAEIRRLRKPDPYKGKGIKYTNEILRRKVGKAGGK